MSGASYDGKRWGRWCYRHATVTLGLWENARLIYEVDLERCNDSAQILDWILQVSKVDVEPSDIGHLVRAFDDLAGHDLQARVCPGGHNEEFDFGSFLRQ